MNVALSDRSHLGRDVGNKCADAHRTYTRRPSCRLCTCGGMYNSIVFRWVDGGFEHQFAE
jgi:hypothetical protein